jgi:cytosine/creatinine deaminase
VSPAGGLLLRRGRLADGRPVDVRCADGVVVAVDTALAVEPGDTVVDVAGRLLLTSFVEPHAHLDKALTAERVPNPSGDLPGAIAAWTEYREHLTLDDIVDRAERAARILLANGTTVIRTHVDLAENVGLRCVEALTVVRRRLEGLVDLQIVALMAPWDDHGLLREAIAAGADVVGGCGHIAPDPAAEVRALLELAAELDRPVDLHTDENLRPGSVDLRAMAAWVRATGYSHQVTASHCCSLGVQDEVTQDLTAAEVAAAGVAVVTLPQTNLYLQSRGHRTGIPRGLTALAPLHAAGAIVAAGGDNLHDPFNIMGRGDPLEAASLLVTAGHLSPEVALDAVSTVARRVLGLAPAGVAVGARADLVAIPARSVREAIGFAPGGRIVVRAGRVVSGDPADGHVEPSEFAMEGQR